MEIEFGIKYSRGLNMLRALPGNSHQDEGWKKCPRVKHTRRKNPSQFRSFTQKTSITDEKGTSNITSDIAARRLVRTTNIRKAERERKSQNTSSQTNQIPIVLISNNETIPFNYYLLTRGEWKPASCFEGSVEFGKLERSLNAIAEVLL